MIRWLLAWFCLSLITVVVWIWMHLIDSLIGCYWLLALMGFDWL